MSFMRGAVQLSRGRDATTKRALIDELSECVKDIQYSSQLDRDCAGELVSGDSTTSLCDSLEAILLHGIKNSLLRRARAFTDAARRSQYDFWALVLVVSHRQTVEQISSLPHVTGPVGQCRAWLRAALNDCLLSSYLSTLQRNTDAVKPFYSRSAFVRDPDMLELAQKLIEGLETCIRFRLPLNSSLLNDWPDSVLRAAGLLTGPSRPAAIGTALDVASMLSDDPAPTSPTTLISSVARHTALDEDEAFKFILSEHSEPEREMAQDQFSDQLVPSPQPINHPDVPTQNQNLDQSTAPLEAKNDYEITKTETNTQANAEPVSLTLIPHNEEVTTFSTVPETTNPFDDAEEYADLSDTQDTEETDKPFVLDVQEVMDLRHMMLGMRAMLSIDDTGEQDKDTENGFEKVEQRELNDREQLGFEEVGECGLSAREREQMTTMLGKLARERGLDSQNYRCAGCEDTLGGGALRAQACAFSGEYFCTACMDPDVTVIPARVVHNWDFGRYAVSRRAARFLQIVQHRPLVDVSFLNARVYSAANALRELRDARVRLGLLRAYAASCRDRERLCAELRRMLWPREYLSESVHAYSPADLAQVPTGSLAAVLHRVTTFLRDHVLSCWLCSQKGFICEVCRSSDLLYPFESNVYRCEVCCGVFHAGCVRTGAQCPRCRRRAARGTSSPQVAAAALGV